MARAGMNSMGEGGARSAGATIGVEDVSHSFCSESTETRALDSVNLGCSAGEFLAIVGPSGCGKSTLLRIIAGLLTPTAGMTRVNGTPVSGPQTDVGIVFQNPVLVNWRTVLGNVMLQIEMRKRNTADYLMRARSLLASVGLADFEANYPGQLSGGMRQRCSLVRALIHDPPLLLMDEPFGALDALTREQMRIDLELLWIASHKTILFITHSIDEAVLLSDRVVVMSARPGRIEKVFDIGLPRPRGLAARRLPQFMEIAEEITNIFLSRGVLSSSERDDMPGQRRETG